MRIVEKAVADLRDHPRNPRRISREALKALEASLDQFELVEPLIWNQRSGYVVGGHQRLSLLRRRGVKTVQVSVVDLDDEKELALMAVLNKPAGEFTPDVDGLIAGLGADLRKSLGLDSLLNGGRGPKAEVVEDVAPAPPKKPVSKPGDLWLLGGHRLLCGDSTKAEDVKRLMGKERAVLIATDPPYGIAYTDQTRVAADRAHVRPLRMPKWEDGIENDERTGSDIQPFLEACFRAAVDAALSQKAAWYLWHAHLTQGFFAAAAAAAAAANLVLSRQIIWVKPSLLFGFGDYHWRHELCFYGWVKGHKPPFYGARNQTTVWEISHEVSNGKREHSTQKPVAIFESPIRNHTREGEIVYEPFSGSGTQIVAAEQIGRRCYAIEIAPAYVDVAVLRWQKLTGKKATNEKTGKPFGA